MANKDWDDGTITTGDSVVATEWVDMADHIQLNDAKDTNADHTGEVTGSAALTVADNVVDEANLKLDEAAVNDYVLTADSAKSGGMKWAAGGGGAGTPGGSDTQMQYNNSSAFGGITNVTSDGTDMFINGKQLNIQSTAPASPSTGDIWIDNS